MDKGGKIILSVLVISIALASLFSIYFVLAQSDNTKEYDSVNKVITIKNPSGTVISDITLNTPQVFNVIRGKDRKVAEFTIDNKLSSQPISSVLEKLDFYNINKGMQKFNRDFTYKYKISSGFRQITDYKTTCVETFDYGNSTILEDCTKTSTGTHQGVETFEWIPLSDLGQISSGKTTIGIFTDVYPNERVEWIPTILGVEISEWAEWTESLNTGLIAYYNFDESNGTTILDNDLGNATLDGNYFGVGENTNWVTGILGNSFNFSFASGNYFNMTYSMDSTNGSINLWINPNAMIDDHILGDDGIQEAGVDNGEFMLGNIGGSNNLIWRIAEGGLFRTLTSDSDIQLNTWTMITITWNSTGMQMYLNATLQSSYVVNPQGPITSLKCWGLGDNLGSGTCTDPAVNGLNGTLDEFGYWNIELTQSQVTQLYNDGTGITYTNVFGDPTPPTTTTPTITPSLPIDSDNLDCSATLTDAEQTSLTANFTWYKNNIANLTGVKTNITNNTNTIITTLLSGNTTKGEEWKCSVIPYDDTNYGNESNSSSVTIVNSITFNVTSGEDQSQISNFNITCDNGFSSIENSPYTTGFANGSYSCTFIKFEHFDKTVIFTADTDKTINVTLSVSGFLTIEEHTWLEAMYECVVNKNCDLYNLLLEINSTVGNVWEITKPTDESVIISENIINRIVNQTHNLTIDYNISIPIKAGYSLGAYLPVRIGFWFLDENNETCFNQGIQPEGIEGPYCQPLITEVIGPMGGYVNFTVVMRPEGTNGDYNIKRIIDIDPLGVWYNYGQEIIGLVTLTENIDEYSISVENIGDSTPKEESVLQNIASGITGAVAGIGSYLISGWQIVMIVGIVGGVLVVFIISRTILQIKKKVINLFFLCITFSFIVFVIFASNVYLIQNPVWGQELTGVRFSATAFGDIDNDGDTDLILTGCLTTGGLRCDAGVIAKIYLNNGTSLVENSVWQQNLTGVGHSSLDLGDIDNDGDLDLVLSGCDDSSGITVCEGNRYSKIYINNGTSFVENSVWQQNLTAVAIGSLIFGDIDNDGKLDLVLTGQLPSGYLAKIYINNGTSLVENSTWQNNLTSGRSGTVSLGDIDNDGDLDLDFAGYDGSSWFAKIYINNGTSFVESSVWSQNFGDWGWPENTFGDYDNDGDLDQLRTGTLTGDHFYIMENNDTTLLINQTNTDQGSCCLIGFFDGSIAFGDYDNDGNLDIGAMGRDGEGGRDHLYENFYNDVTQNSWNVTFDRDSTAVNNITIDIRDGSLAWIDLDNDNDLDLIMIGSSSDLSDIVAKTYISNASLTTPNTLPSAPSSSFSSSSSSTQLNLSWGAGSDAETPTLGLYYNLMVGNSTKNHTIVSGVYGGSSNPTAGYFGNMMQRKAINLSVNLADGTYYWYVQTIDTGLAKSLWSSGQSFTVGAVDDSGNGNGGGGGGGGGGSSTITSFWTSTEVVSDEEFSKGIVKELSEKQRVKVSVSGEDHYVGIVDLTNETATINITSDPIQVILGIGEETKIDVLHDGFYDIYVLLNSINNSKANLTIQSINEEIPEGEDAVVVSENESGKVADGEKEGINKGRILYWGIIILIIGLVLFGIKFLRERWRK